jgi:hypothetical protein
VETTTVAEPSARYPACTGGEGACLGYLAHGQEFLEAGIPHIAMTKTLG